jgi:hypothetical protein
MLKAKALSLKNKDRDIFESKDPFKNTNKFEATVAKRAKELVKIKKDKDAFLESEDPLAHVPHISKREREMYKK